MRLNLPSLPRPKQFSLRQLLIGLLTATIVLTALPLILATLLLRLPQIVEEERTRVQSSLFASTFFLTQYLDSAEHRLLPIIRLLESGQVDEARNLLRLLDPEGDMFLSVVLATEAGRVIASLPESSARLVDGHAAFVGALTQTGWVWRDRSPSVVTGLDTVSVAQRMGNHVLLAEIDDDRLLASFVFMSVGGAFTQPVVLLDNRGRWISDNRGRPEWQTLDWSQHPAIRGLRESGELPLTVELDGQDVRPVVRTEDRLGWILLSGAMTGMYSPAYRTALLIAGLGLLLAGFMAALIAPMGARILRHPLDQLLLRSQAVAAGRYTSGGQPLRVQELDRLAENLHRAAAAIAAREDELIASRNELRQLNEALETRVLERTQELRASNAELNTALQQIQRAQGQLIEAEKLAALGRMVAGLAHELNTPIGNNVMAVSSLRERVEDLAQKLNSGSLTRSALQELLDELQEGLEIAARTGERAAALVSSYKQAAADRKLSQIRRFDLASTLRETLLTLQPMIRQHGVQLLEDYSAGIMIKTDPGALAQVVSNIVTNAIVHGFESRNAGELTLRSRLIQDQSVRIEVIDDGRGIDAENLPHVFEPFFTTRLGQGGSGLGLHLVHRLVTEVLSGKIELESRSGVGTRVIIDLPLAPPSEPLDPAELTIH